jgi:hypothetical protein
MENCTYIYMPDLLYLPPHQCYISSYIIYLPMSIFPCLIYLVETKTALFSDLMHNNDNLFYKKGKFLFVFFRHVSFCAEMIKLTIIWYHRVTMAMRG